MTRLKYRKHMSKVILDICFCISLKTLKIEEDFILKHRIVLYKEVKSMKNKYYVRIHEDFVKMIKNLK